MTPAEFTAARQLLKFSPSALADEWGINLKTVQRWESGRIAVPSLAAYCIGLMVERAGLA